MEKKPSHRINNKFFIIYPRSIKKPNNVPLKKKKKLVKCFRWRFDIPSCQLH